MDKFFERFAPGGGKKSGKKNPFGNLLSGQGGGKFSGHGQSLGGSLPGKVIPIELKEPGPLGIRVEKRSNTSQSAIVAMVVQGSQADKAGLQRGDILCFQGSNGSEEIMYDQFLELAKSDLRPLCLEVRRIPATKASKSNNSNHSSSSSADAYARKQAVIAAAEAREKAAKAKSRPIPKKDSNYPNMLSTAERQRLEQERLARAQQMMQDNEPKSEEARKAAEAAKNKEAKAAAELGYNPYETSRATAGQARNATVTQQHGALQGGEGKDAAIPKVQQPRDPARGERVAFDPQFTQAYETCVTLNDHAAVVSSFGIMRKLIVNATAKGQTNEEDAAKFRRVRLGNPKIKAAIVDVEGAFDLMMSVGFSLIEEDGESFLVFPAGFEGPDWLQAALKRMERYEKS